MQDVDYAYTLQGWLKGVNSTTVSDGTWDMGLDGKAGSMNSNIARDVYGFAYIIIRTMHNTGQTMKPLAII